MNSTLNGMHREWWGALRLDGQFCNALGKQRCLRFSVQ